MNLILKVQGQNETQIRSNETVANWLQSYCDGRNATEEQASKIDQAFVDKWNIQIHFDHGRKQGPKFDDEMEEAMLDEYEAITGQ